MSNISINISPQNITGKCDSKCSYNFKYEDTNLTAKNNGMMITLKSDDTQSSPVLYNKQKYSVGNIMLVAPSLHIFNYNKTKAEILIEHVPVTTGDRLIVCVPIIESTNYTEATGLLTNIIDDVATNAPSEGEVTNINMSDFNLNNIVPKRPFFTYTGLDINSHSSDFIVFGQLEGIPLNSDTLNTLYQIIKECPLPTPGTDLFVNSKGPNVKKNDGIYISCKPTGSSTEETTVTTTSDDTSSSSSSTNAIWNNPTGKVITKVIIATVLFVIIYMLISKAYMLLTTDPPRLVGLKIPGIGVIAPEKNG